MSAKKNRFATRVASVSFALVVIVLASSATADSCDVGDSGSEAPPCPSGCFQSSCGCFKNTEDCQTMIGQRCIEIRGFCQPCR